MNKETIINYIENGQETELLDKLNSYAFSVLDKRFWNLLGILVVLQEKAKIDWYQPNQMLVKQIVDVLPGLFENEGTQLSALFEVLSKNAIQPYTNLSYLCRQFIIGIGDKDVKITSSGLKDNEYNLLIEKFWTLNLNLLKLSMADKNSTHEQITTIFYNNVEHLEKNRRTILRENALLVYRQYIRINPKPYLEGYIRPYWTGTTVDHLEHYYHVPEPFQNQIFTEQLAWLDFIDSAKIAGLDMGLINDLQAFQQDYNSKPLDNEDRKVILYSDEMRNLRHDMPPKRIKLLSDLHKGVRKECLPPSYSLK